MERLKWVEKEINPTIIEREILLTKDEKHSLQKRLNNVKLEFRIDFSFNFKKTLKLNDKEVDKGICWNEDNEIEDSIINLLNELKNKT